VLNERDHATGGQGPAHGELRRRKARVRLAEGNDAPVRSALTPGPPTTFLQLLDHTLASRERTTNATELLASGSMAIARIVRSVGYLLLASIGLAAILIHFAGIGPAIGGGVAVVGTGLVWGARSLWMRRLRTRPSSRRAN